MNKTLPILLVVIGLVVAGGAYMLMGAEPAMENTTPVDTTMTGSEVVPDATSDSMMAEEKMMAEGEVDYTLEMGMFYFKPNLIEAEAGQTVRVKIVNADGMHDFVIDELGVQSSVLKDEGAEEIVEIVIPADASGKEYEFYCSVMEHRAKGMVGVLRIK